MSGGDIPSQSCFLLSPFLHFSISPSNTSNIEFHIRSTQYLPRLVINIINTAPTPPSLNLRDSETTRRKLEFISISINNHCHIFNAFFFFLFFSFFYHIQQSWTIVTPGMNLSSSSHLFSTCSLCPCPYQPEIKSISAIDMPAFSCSTFKRV